MAFYTFKIFSNYLTSGDQYSISKVNLCFEFSNSKYKIHCIIYRLSISKGFFGTIIPASEISFPMIYICKYYIQLIYANPQVVLVKKYMDFNISGSGRNTI